MMVEFLLGFLALEGNPLFMREMYSIVQAYHQWKHYIIGKDTIIDIAHKPMQFIQTHGKL